MKVEKVIPEPAYRVELTKQDYNDLRSALTIAEMKTDDDALRKRCADLWEALYKSA